jgi:hypothetical protein
MLPEPAKVESVDSARGLAPTGAAILIVTTISTSAAGLSTRLLQSYAPAV